MEITWLGHSCFRLKGKAATVITDPFDSSIGYNLGKPSANIVTISIDLPDHNNAQEVAGDPMVIDSPGEYEVSGVLVSGIASRSRDPEGHRNTVYVFEMDDLRL
ncbi:MAG: MBL fold metallo-hydrolase, partial [Dehalococcoidia bacterium]|nr:MBL fold metallo-hydrolase [Dehalococcoidia bacterium]